MKFYIISIETPLEGIPEILKGLPSEARLVTIAPKVSATGVGTRRPRMNNGISGRDLLVQQLSAGSKTYAELQQIFTDNGFSAKSVSPILSKMSSTIVRNTGGRIALKR